MIESFLALAAELVLAACGSSEPEAAAPPASSPAARETPSASPTPSPTYKPATPPKPEPLFPKGYPKVVAVAFTALPGTKLDQMAGGGPQAVAIAPGVWTQLPPGASKLDAAMSGSYDGFCASIAAYSRKFRDGEQCAGTCWSRGKVGSCTDIG